MKKAGNGRAKRQRQISVYRQRAIVVGIVLFVLLLFYCLIANSYKNKFLRNTWINHIKVSGMTADEAEALLKESVEQYKLTLHFQDDETKVLDHKALGYEYVSSKEVEKLLKAQKRFQWLSHLLGKHSEYTVQTSYVFDVDVIRASIEALPQFQDYVSPKDAYMSLTNHFDFEIIPEVEGNQLDEDVVTEAVQQAVSTGEEELNLTKTEGAYLRPKVYAKDEDLKEQVADVNSYLSTTVRLFLKDGTKRTISRASLLSWLRRDDNGYYTIDSAKVADRCWSLVQRLASKYNETSSALYFESTNLGTKTLYGEPYGYKIDVDAVAEQLCNDVIAKKSEDIEVKSSVQEKADPTFGGNYIEVDVTNQHVYFYKDGELFLDTPCVTGLESDPERKTPSGLFYIYGKDENKTLEGRLTADGPVTYSSDVDCWMPFYESYGMHDAPWRDEFGGTIYKYAGSHGCVNLPVSAAKTIFKNAPVGTTVIVLRSSD